MDCRPSCWETPSPTCSRFRVQGGPTVKYPIEGFLLPAIMENQMEKKSEKTWTLGLCGGLYGLKNPGPLNYVGNIDCRPYGA